MSGVVHLRKFSTTFYKDKSASDAAQIVAAGATINVYKQGATVSNSPTVTTGGGGTSVSVYSLGHLVVNDTVQLGTDATKQMLVLAILSDTLITLRSTTGSNISISSGSRLVIYSSLPSLYTDSSGTAALANPTTTDSVGAVVLYTPEAKFDLIVSGTGITTTLMQDNESGWMKGGSTWVNAKDYSTIQAAVDALSLSVRGVVFIPAGTYTPSTTPAFNGIDLNYTNTHLRGEGGFTTLQMTDVNTNLINIKAFNCTVKDLSLIGPSSAGTGIGINCYNASTNMTGIIIENVGMDGTASWGVSITADVGFSCYRNFLTNVDIANSASGGSLLYGAAGVGSTTLYAEGCHFHGPGFGTHGVAATRGGVHVIQNSLSIFDKCYFEMFSSTTALSFAGVNELVSLRDCGFEFTTGSGDNQQYMITNSGTLNGLSITSTLATRTSTAVGIRFLSSEATANIRNAKFDSLYCGDHHASSQTDDVVLGAALDELLLLNVRHISAVTGADRLFRCTSRAGLTYLVGDMKQQQIRLQGVTGHAAITVPLDGTLIYDSTLHRFKYYENGTWKSLDRTNS